MSDETPGNCPEFFKSFKTFNPLKARRVFGCCLIFSVNAVLSTSDLLFRPHPEMKKTPAHATKVVIKSLWLTSLRFPLNIKNFECPTQPLTVNINQAIMQTQYCPLEQVSQEQYE